MEFGSDGTNQFCTILIGHAQVEDHHGEKLFIDEVMPLATVCCLYCELDMQADELAVHLDECPVREAVHSVEQKLNRLLTDQEIEEIRRERFT